MAIAFVDANPFPKYSGGMENWLFHLIGILNEKGVSCVVFASKSDADPFYDIVQYENVKLIELPFIQGYERSYAIVKRFIPRLWFCPLILNYLLWTIGAWRVIRKHAGKRDRLIALHTVPAMLPLILFRCFGGRNSISCSVRGMVGTELREMKKPILAWLYTKTEKIVLGFADQVISNGEDTAASLRNELGLDSKVSPNGVDFEKFVGTNPSSGSWENHWIDKLMKLRHEKVAIVMTVATLRGVKGIRFLIQASAHLQKEFAGPFKVIFVGKGDPSAYQEYAAGLGVAERVMFVGEQKAVASFLRLADVAVPISGVGGVSHALLEKMAAGKPIVAWDNLTYSQVLTHGVSGHLVKERDSVALAHGILCLLRDREYASSLGKAAQEVARGYDWRVIADRFPRDHRQELNARHVPTLGSHALGRTRAASFDFPIVQACTRSSRRSPSWVDVEHQWFNR